MSRGVLGARIGALVAPDEPQLIPASSCGHAIPIDTATHQPLMGYDKCTSIEKLSTQSLDDLLRPPIRGQLCHSPFALGGETKD